MLPTTVILQRFSRPFTAEMKIVETLPMPAPGIQKTRSFIARAGKGSLKTRHDPFGPALKNIVERGIVHVRV
jgi:hypothetical protein